MPVDIDALEASLRGRLVRRRGAHRAGRHRPVVDVRVADVADIMRTVEAVSGSEARLAIRSGGRGASDADPSVDGVVIDLRAMRGVHIDPMRRIARVEGGATWGDLDHAAGAFGLATTGGIVSSTGAVGVILGGGIGHLARRHGLSCDNLRSADVVLADGSFVTTSEYDHGDLFWALRGGGETLGVVTSIELQLHRVGIVYGGVIFFELEDAAVVLRFLRDFVDEAPEELGASFSCQEAPPLPCMPADRVGEVLCSLAICWAGDTDAGARVIQPCLDAGRVVASHLDRMPYPALNAFFDPVGQPRRRFAAAACVAELSDEVIDAQLARVHELPVADATVRVHPISGAARRVDAEETAFGHRDARFACILSGPRPEDPDDMAVVGWMRAHHRAVRVAAAVGSDRAHETSDDQPTRVREDLDRRSERLGRVAAAYDPERVFRSSRRSAPALP